jgi:hypothetical protein
MEKVLWHSIEHESARENKVEITDPIYPKAGNRLNTI